MEIAQRFTIIKQDDGSYDIEHQTFNSAASIDKHKNITYFVTGCYNSGNDWLEIDINSLEELKELCELIVKGELK